VVRAARDEVSFDPRQALVGAVSRGLPHLGFNRTRTALLRACGVRMGVRSLILGPLDITGPGRIDDLLRIGHRTFLTGPVHIDLGAAVLIGDDVRIGQHVVLLTVDHDIGPPDRRCGRLVGAPISIGDGVWIGSRVTVLPGVSIASGSVIAAGAIVVRDVPPNVLVAGVPARVVRHLEREPTPSSIRRSRSAPLGD
jgi:maltose O-acetyltransferase